MRLLASPIVALVLLLPASAAHAATTLYVDGESRGGRCDDGRSAAAVTAGTPWCSLARAVDAAPATGATVLVAGGRYPELELGGEHGRTALLRFRGTPGREAVIGGLRISDSSYLAFEGFTFTGSVDVRDGAHHVEIVRNHLPGQAIWLMRTDRVLVDGNHVHDIAADSSTKIGIRLMHDTNATVRGNRIENLVEDPIQATKSTGLLIEGNTLRNAHPDVGEHTDAMQILGGDRITIRSNTIRDIEHGLMFTDFQASDVRIENNVISLIDGQGMKADGTYGMPGLTVLNNTWMQTGGAVDFRIRQPGGVVRNNIFWSVAGLGSQPVAEHNLVVNPSSGADYGLRAITGAPTFVDARAGDYELAAGSKGIDAGSAVGPATDRHGRARADDPAVANSGTGTPDYTDIGALERQVGHGHNAPAAPDAAPGSPAAPVQARWRPRRLRVRRTGRRLAVAFASPGAGVARIRLIDRRKRRRAVVRVRRLTIGAGRTRLRVRRRGADRVVVRIGPDAARLGAPARRAVRR